ncbi:MAG: shikimate dehydrogenase family protein [Eubacteriales bacterium]
MNHYALIGEKLGHSFSPEIHNIIFKYTDMQGDYTCVEIPKESVKQDVKNLFREYHGINVTIPYKKEIVPILDALDTVSLDIGAVNTIKIEKGSTKGYNTDYYGFGATLDYYHVDIQDKKAVILGTGGASKAVYYYLIQHGIGEIIFVNRRKETHWAKECPIYTYDEVHQLSGDLVVNCTPMGMGELAGYSPLSKDVRKNFKTTFDLVYNPKETLLLKWSREQGSQSINGLFMLVAQAVRAQEIWNDKTIDPLIIEKIYHQVYNQLYVLV